jgi:hypothetical protein
VILTRSRINGFKEIRRKVANGILGATAFCTLALVLGTSFGKQNPLFNWICIAALFLCATALLVVMAISVVVEYMIDDRKPRKQIVRRLIYLVLLILIMGDVAFWLYLFGGLIKK